MEDMTRHDGIADSPARRTKLMAYSQRYGDGGRFRRALESSTELDTAESWWMVILKSTSISSMRIVDKRRRY